jgi:hypothetical protein
MSWPMPQSRQELLVLTSGLSCKVETARSGDLSCEAETARGGDLSCDAETARRRSL